MKVLHAVLSNLHLVAHVRDPNGPLPDRKKSRLFPSFSSFVEAEVHGSGAVEHFVNGEKVIEYEQIQFDERDADAKKLIQDKKLLIEGGTISLQSESHPIDFRKVEIKILKK